MYKFSLEQGGGKWFWQNYKDTVYAAYRQLQSGVHRVSNKRGDRVDKYILARIRNWK